MADEHEVPPPVERSDDRIKGRDYESDFAALPESETHPRTEPGAGPHGGTGTSGTNAPVITMAIGGLIALSVFVLQSPWVLAVGLAIFVGAAIWAGVAHRSPGTMAGTGPTVIEGDDTTT
jgi:hypothetical protein